MKLPLVAVAVLALALGGCQSTKLSAFLGSSDPCTQAELIYAGWATFAANTPKANTPQAKKYAKAGIELVRAQCSDGNISKFELQKALRAYVATINALK